MTDGDISQRKVDHIDLCAREEVEFRLKSTLLEQVHLVHNSLPELDVSELDLSTELVGKKIAAPVVITGMTGGAEKAREINRVLARVAEKHQIAFGVGSQRAMLVRPETTSTYEVRDVAPTALIFGNIGVVQARDISTSEAEDLAGSIGADALCVHLNPAQEMIQVDGDRDFRGCLDALGRLSEELSIPIIAKETGCGLSPAVISALIERGVDTFDVSGAGGTTWVGVEVLRARGNRRIVGEDYWEWGLPTGAVVLAMQDEPVHMIASGGLRSGHDIARAIALGARAGGMALPFLRAVDKGGFEAADFQAQRVIDGIEAAMVLTGSRNLAELRSAPRFIGAELERWAETLHRAKTARAVTSRSAE